MRWSESSAGAPLAQGFAVRAVLRHMRHAQKRLYALVERVFEDGVVSPEERSELVSLYRQDGLSVSDVKEVFRAFAHVMWGRALSDGVLTDEERAKLRTIVTELRLPPECIPEILPALT